MGLASAVVAGAEVPGKVDAVVAQLSALSPAALAATKKAMYVWDSMHFDKGLARAEKIYLEELMQTEDAREGVKAFLEKREPKWAREVMITDCHIHISPLEMFKPSALELMRAKRPNFAQIEEYCRSPKAFLKFLDAAGIDRAVLINYVAPEVIGFTAGVNQFVADYVKEDPEAPALVRQPASAALDQYSFRCGAVGAARASG